MKKLLPQIDLNLPLRYLKGVGPYLSSVLEKKGLCILEDLLFYLPHRYVDKRRITAVKDVFQGERIVLKLKFLGGAVKYLGKRRVYEWQATDGTGIISLMWFYFREKYMKNKFDLNKHYLVYGQISLFKSKIQIIHPEIIEWSDDNLGIDALYPLTEGITQKKIKSLIHKSMEYINHLEDSAYTVRSDGTEKVGLKEAIAAVHCPPESANLIELNEYRTLWHKRIIYDELFYLQLGLLLKKRDTQKECGYLFANKSLYEKALKLLPYQLTEFQESVLNDIFNDFILGHPMNRLLQGDVGSGKTIVSFLSTLPVIEAGYQCCLMAPTEILAEQHLLNLTALADNLGLKISLLTSSTPKPERQNIIENLTNGSINLLIGTHALFSDDILFKNLAYVIIDEQHRFGVKQRAKLRSKSEDFKGRQPHVLVMTATPIPRTLSMTLHGDLDISLMKGRPSGRQPIKTKVIYESRRQNMYGFIYDELSKGAQAYFVCPLIEESEKSDLKNATLTAQELTQKMAPFKIGLLHGKMKPDEKDGIMNSFKKNKIQVLVSTTVIEVGVDVPQATIMVIEHAERFGLSQLHQLRGRVGRGGAQSYCFLLTGYQQSQEARHRLQIMEESNDGFIIAEEDLKIRGPGDFMGTRQAGMPEFKISYLLNEEKLLVMARKRAAELLIEDPTLSLAKHVAIKNVLKKRWQNKLMLSGIS